MWDVIVRFITGFIPSLAGFFIIKNIIKSNQKLFQIKNIIWISILGMTSIFSYNEDYNILIPLLTFILSIPIYKRIFKYNCTYAILNSCILMTFIAIAELIMSLILTPFIDLQSFRQNIMMQLAFAPSISLIAIGISYIPFIKKFLYTIITKTNNDRLYQIMIFIFIVLLSILLLFYILVNNYQFSFEYIICLLCCTIFVVLDFIYLQERNQYMMLNQKYDVLLKYVSEFSDWMEEEQLNKHESNNNLAILRTKVKNREAIKYIDEKLIGNMKVDSNWSTTLKNLPKGSLKGLIFYKMVLAKNADINLIIDISPTVTRLIEKMNEESLKIICYLFGIFTDNALYAASISVEKSVSIEIYTRVNKLFLIISNSYSGIIDFNRFNLVGYTTRGKGHGHGLKLAKKIIDNQKNVKERRRIIGQFYIESLEISI